MGRIHRLLSGAVPGLAALLTCKYLGRDFSSLGWKWGKSRYEVVCYLIPLAYGAAIYAFVWLTGLGGFYNTQFVRRFSGGAFGLGPMRPWVSILLYFLFTATDNCSQGTTPRSLERRSAGEDFLLPELAKGNSFATTAPSSLWDSIWALWHYPIFLLADGYNGGHTGLVLPLHCSLYCSSAIQLCVDVDEAQVRQFVAAYVLHAAHNTFMQVFDPTYGRQ